jgi:hypothetical protein
VANRQNFSHLLDETISFSNEIHELFGKDTDIPDVVSLFLEPKILDIWVELEKDAISIGVDEILADPHAFENRFEVANDVDTVRCFLNSYIPACLDDGSKFCRYLCDSNAGNVRTLYVIQRFQFAMSIP